MPMNEKELMMQITTTKLRIELHEDELKRRGYPYSQAELMVIAALKDKLETLESLQKGDEDE